MSVVILGPERHQLAFDCCGLTRTDAVEDALKAMLELTGQGLPVGTTKLAHHLGVTPPTSSAMVKRLVGHGLVERIGVRDLGLTEHGAGHARHIIRRHRLLETFLVDVLKMPWDEVYAEAELLEHAVSDVLLARIDDLLGHPRLDPHGDPIPHGAEAHVESWGQSLDDVPVGSRFQVERIHHRDGEALRYLAHLGLRPGVTVDVVERAPFGGPVWVRLDGRAHALGVPLTRLVHGTVIQGRAQ